MKRFYLLLLVTMVSIVSWASDEEFLASEGNATYWKTFAGDGSAILRIGPDFDGVSPDEEVNVTISKEYLDMYSVVELDLAEFESKAMEIMGEPARYEIRLDDYNGRVTVNQIPGSQCLGIYFNSLQVYNILSDSYLAQGAYEGKVKLTNGYAYGDLYYAINEHPDYVWAATLCWPLKHDNNDFHVVPFIPYAAPGEESRDVFVSSYQGIAFSPLASHGGANVIFDSMDSGMKFDVAEYTTGKKYISSVEAYYNQYLLYLEESSQISLKLLDKKNGRFIYRNVDGENIVIGFDVLNDEVEKWNGKIELNSSDFYSTTDGLITTIYLSAFDRIDAGYHLYVPEDRMVKFINDHGELRENFNGITVSFDKYDWYCRNNHDLLSSGLIHVYNEINTYYGNYYAYEEEGNHVAQLLFAKAHESYIDKLEGQSVTVVEDRVFVDMDSVAYDVNSISEFAFAAIPDDFAIFCIRQSKQLIDRGEVVTDNRAPLHLGSSAPRFNAVYVKPEVYAAYSKDLVWRDYLDGDKLMPYDYSFSDYQFNYVLTNVYDTPVDVDGSTISGEVAICSRNSEDNSVYISDYIFDDGKNYRIAEILPRSIFDVDTVYISGSSVVIDDNSFFSYSESPIYPEVHVISQLSNYKSVKEAVAELALNNLSAVAYLDYDGIIYRLDDMNSEMTVVNIASHYNKIKTSFSVDDVPYTLKYISGNLMYSLFLPATDEPILPEGEYGIDANISVPASMYEQYALLEEYRPMVLRRNLRISEGILFPMGSFEVAISRKYDSDELFDGMYVKGEVIIVNDSIAGGNEVVIPRFVTLSDGDYKVSKVMPYTFNDQSQVTNIAIFSGVQFSDNAFYGSNSFTVRLSDEATVTQNIDGLVAFASDIFPGVDVNFTYEDLNLLYGVTSDGFSVVGLSSSYKSGPAKVPASLKFGDNDYYIFDIDCRKYNNPSVDLYIENNDELVNLAFIGDEWPFGTIYVPYELYSAYCTDEAYSRFSDNISVSGAHTYYNFLVVYEDNEAAKEYSHYLSGFATVIGVDLSEIEDGMECYLYSECYDAETEKSYLINRFAPGSITQDAHIVINDEGQYVDVRGAAANDADVLFTVRPAVLRHYRQENTKFPNVTFDGGILNSSDYLVDDVTGIKYKYLYDRELDDVVLGVDLAEYAIPEDVNMFTVPSDDFQNYKVTTVSSFPDRSTATIIVPESILALGNGSIEEDASLTLMFLSSECPELDPGHIEGTDPYLFRLDCADAYEKIHQPIKAIIVPEKNESYVYLSNLQTRFNNGTQNPASLIALKSNTEVIEKEPSEGSGTGEEPVEEIIATEVAVSSGEDIENLFVAIDLGVSLGDEVVVKLEGDVEATKTVEVVDGDGSTVVKTAFQQLKSSDEKPMNIILDGDGYTLKAEVLSSDDGSAALVSNLGEDGAIKNIAIEVDEINVENTENLIKSDDNQTSYIGIFANVNKGTISNVSFRGKVTYDDALLTGNVELALVGDNAEGTVESCTAFFEDVDIQPSDGNKKLSVVMQNVGLGRNAGNIKKSCSNGKLSQTAKKALSMSAPCLFDEESDEVNSNFRVYTNDEYVTGEPAYWMNYGGRGYTGAYNSKWTTDNEGFPVLTMNPSVATIRLAYTSDDSDVDIVGTGFANQNGVAKVSYSRPLQAISVDGQFVAVGDGFETTFPVPAINPLVNERATIEVALYFDSNPTALEPIEFTPDAATSVSVRNGKIAISTAVGQTYQVTDIQGRKVAGGICTSGNLSIKLPSAGIYVVTVGDVVKKVLVK